MVRQSVQERGDHLGVPAIISKRDAMASNSPSAPLSSRAFEATRQCVVKSPKTARSATEEDQLSQLLLGQAASECHKIFT